MIVVYLAVYSLPMWIDKFRLSPGTSSAVINMTAVNGSNLVKSVFKEDKYKWFAVQYIFSLCDLL